MLLALKSAFMQFFVPKKHFKALIISNMLQKPLLIAIQYLCYFMYILYYCIVLHEY